MTNMLLLISMLVISIGVFFIYIYLINIKKSEEKKKEYLNLTFKINKLKQEEEEIKAKINYEKQNIDNLIEAYKKGSQEKYNIFKENLQKDQEELKEKYIAAETTYKSHFLELMEESATDFYFRMKEYKDSMINLEDDLNELQVAYNSRIEIAKHEQEEASKRDYYRWQLTSSNIEDIKKIESIKSTLVAPDIVGKVLWKAYYEKATNELIARVIGNSTPCGIYKITNLLNEKVYIGQSVNIKDRVRQHAKCGCGATAASNNKLYTSMKQDGLWNFTWEIVEECSREKLNEREAFWIDFYDAAGYGLNGNSGIKC